MKSTSSSDQSGNKTRPLKNPMSELDLDEWEFLPEDGLLDLHDGGEVKLPSSPGRCPFSNSVLDMSYFGCQPGRGNPRVIPDVLDLTVGDRPLRSEDQETFFEKSKENEFDDKKSGDATDNPSCSLRTMKCEALTAIEEIGEADRGTEDAGGLNLWKRSVDGIGAFCSFGVAAAAFCFLVIVSQNGKKHQKQSISFQIYPDDKRIMRVLHHPNKLNEAVFAARGLPQTRAQVVFGCHYDGF